MTSLQISSKIEIVIFNTHHEALMLEALKRLGPQAALIALCVACGSSGPGAGGQGGGVAPPSRPIPRYTGPIEGQIPEAERKKMCQEYQAIRERAADEAEIAYPGAPAENSVVVEFKKKKTVKYLDLLCRLHQVDAPQMANVLAEGAHSRWWDPAGETPQTTATPTSVNFAKHPDTATRATRQKKSNG